MAGQMIEYIGKHKMHQLNRIKKLFEYHGLEKIPENVSKLNRFKRREIIHMLKRELENPTIPKEEMLMIIESMPTWNRHKPRPTYDSDFRVGNVTNYKQAISIVVSLSVPTKMPCYSYNLPAQFCITGSKLAGVENTICNGCYALKGWYTMSWVQNAMKARLKSIWHPDWVDAMIWLIRHFKQKNFRWHDSGDLQSVQHLVNILYIAKELPDVQFWLPTREYGIVEKYWNDYNNKKSLSKTFPNISIRLSANKFEEKPPVRLAKKLGVQTSMVTANKPTCPAHNQNNSCLDCRTCWDQKEFCVVYKKH